MKAFYHLRWPVFYEDNHLLVFYKPAGLVVQKDHKGKANLLDLAKAWIKEKYNKPGRAYAGMVHRLDAPVAGVIVLARTSKAASRLSTQFRDRVVEKNYLAMVEGSPAKAEDRLVHELVREGRLSRISDTATASSRTAVLGYRLLERRTNESLLSVELESGRRHQIRAQLAAIDCPILGDINYGASKSLTHGRIALLAHELAFDHPTKGIRLKFSSPLPQGWPWPGQAIDPDAPLWTIEEFLDSGMILPDLTMV